MKVKIVTALFFMTLAQTSLADYFVKVPNVDVSVGNDIAEFGVSSLEECQNACLADKDCQAYNFINSSCWLKDKIVELVPCNIDSCMSGLRVHSELDGPAKN